MNQGQISKLNRPITINEIETTVPELQGPQGDHQRHRLTEMQKQGLILYYRQIMIGTLSSTAM